MKANDIDVCRFEELAVDASGCIISLVQEMESCDEKWKVAERDSKELNGLIQQITAYLRQQQVIEDEAAKCCTIVADGTKGLVTP